MDFSSIILTLAIRKYIFFSFIYHVCLIFWLARVPGEISRTHFLKPKKIRLLKTKYLMDTELLHYERHFLEGQGLEAVEVKVESFGDKKNFQAVEATLSVSDGDGSVYIDFSADCAGGRSAALYKIDLIVNVLNRARKEIEEAPIIRP